MAERRGGNGGVLFGDLELKIEEKFVELMPARIQVAEAMRQVYQVTVEAGTPRSALTNPQFWKHVSRNYQFAPYTRLEVATDDCEYFVELIVLSAGDNWAKVQEIRFIELGNSDIIKEASKMLELEVKYKGPHLKYCVQRKSDGERIKEGFQSKEDASRYLIEYSRTMTK